MNLPERRTQLPNGGTTTDTHAAMDQMYRHQRYIYDLSRKFYLFGRDRLLRDMTVRPGDTVLEVGCGTGRNLGVLAGRHRESDFFGLDASAAMLETARSRYRTKKPENLSFAIGLADNFGYFETFGLNGPFDTIFFSYSISMIPTWREAILNALRNLVPGGRLYIVDFYDQRDLPVFFGKALQGWLNLFHVRYRKGLIPFLEECDGDLSIVPLYRRYAFIAEFQKSGLSE